MASPRIPENLKPQPEIIPSLIAHSRQSQPRQAVCAVCGQKANPGTAVVLTYGAGGRVHKVCPPPPKPPSEAQLAARQELAARAKLAVAKRRTEGA